MLAAQGTGLIDGGEVPAEGLGAGALSAVTQLGILKIRFNDRGSELLAAALAQGALARLENLLLASANIGDAGLVALAPAVRQLIAIVDLADNGTRSATKASPHSWRRRQQLKTTMKALCLAARSWRVSRRSASKGPR